MENTTENHEQTRYQNEERLKNYGIACLVLGCLLILVGVMIFVAITGNDDEGGWIYLVAGIVSGICLLVTSAFLTVISDISTSLKQLVEKIAVLSVSKDPEWIEEHNEESGATNEVISLKSTMPGE
jgi:hypothetical protein